VKGVWKIIKIFFFLKYWCGWISKKFSSAADEYNC
jgi:hypothetical protein